MGDDSSLPILKRSMRLLRRGLFCLLPFWPRWGLCLRPMFAMSDLRKLILVVGSNFKCSLVDKALRKCKFRS